MHSRSQPFFSKIKKREKISKPGSSRDTYHIVLEGSPSLEFHVGDSIGALPQNDPHLVDLIIKKLDAKADESIEDPKTGKSFLFRDFLLHKANINRVSFHKIFSVEKTSSHLLDLVETLKPSPHELCKILLPLMPRFYSIASSRKMFPDEIHLTVAHTQFSLQGKPYFGVGSHFLCSQAEILLSPIPIYVQPSHSFRLPSNPDAPIIMIGPGTGVAPFRAFIQERLALRSEGKNWLFFGERNQKTDFYYEEFFKELEAQGRLRLDTAFSRDQPEKIYVQHKMLEHKKALWQWIQEGAYLYVCGDAEKMAKDVDGALLQIGAEEGNMNREEARLFFKNLRQEKRYLLDVY